MCKDAIFGLRLCSPAAINPAIDRHPLPRRAVISAKMRVPLEPLAAERLAARWRHPDTLQKLMAKSTRKTIQTVAKAPVSDVPSMAARFAALPPAEQALVELLVLEDAPVSWVLLGRALGLCGLDPFWVSPSPGEARRRLDPLERVFFRYAQGDYIVAIEPGALRLTVVRSLLASGRARKIAAMVEGAHWSQLADLESPYQQSLRARLRLAAALGGAGPEHFDLNAFQATTASAAADVLLPLKRFTASLGVEFCRQLSPFFAGPTLVALLRSELSEPKSAEASAYTFAMQQYQERAKLRPQLLLPLFEHALLRGEPRRLLDVDGCDSVIAPAFEACAQLLEGATAEQVLPAFERALLGMRKLNSQRYRHIGIPGLLHLACLSVGTTARDAKRREQLMRATVDLHFSEGGHAQAAWQKFTAARLEGRSYAGVAGLSAAPKLPALDAWWYSVLYAWSGLPLDGKLRSTLQAACEQAMHSGWRWLAAQISAALDETCATAASPPLLTWIQPMPQWQSALEALGQAIAAQTGKVGDAAAPATYSQLKAMVDAFEGEQHELRIELIEMRPLAKGGWSQGREIRSVQGMANLGERLPPGDDPDRALLAAMMADLTRRDFYGEFAAHSRSVAALVGHPRVFDLQGEPLQVIEIEPRLQTQRLPDGRIELKLVPAVEDAQPFLLRRSGQLLRFKPSPIQARIGSIIGRGLALPPEALSPLLQLLPELGRSLRLDEGLEALGLLAVEASSSLVAQLEPAGQGLALRLGVRPLGEHGPFLLPGQGSEAVLGQQQGQACRALRDLAAERAALQALEAELPQLAGLAPGEVLRAESPDEALDLLAQLQDRHGMTLEWKAGKPIRIGRPRADDPLQIKVGAKRDWFSATGALTLEDGSVIALAEVLRSLPSGQGRYLRLDGERMLALDAELRRRLQVLRAFADERGQVQVPAAAALALEGALDDASQLDAGFRKQLKRMRDAEGLRPALPLGLQAELRDYQVDGYRFLMRLAAWGAGACLADDMGLGKTVQALAVLLARAGEGPALVVAPTSLIGNWRNEARRFTPALSLRIYGEGDREAALADLGKTDVVLVSYGLLVANIEAFSGIEFASLVLDEAQAFKNAATQRAQAVRQIQAGFRVAATGTPLENHLGELWSLFRVLNPGLLGSEEAFRKRFLLPMERDPRGPQRDILRRLIAPFLLRRTKAEVLSELPPRTEIVLKIEPSAGEAQLQAALRRQALARIAAAQSAGESQRFQVLAELTRLRRAACHPQLVAPELKLPSAKLEQLVELVQELIENRHRALVFSQFTDYLALVRERLDAEGIGYRYLDGSTPAKQREVEVNAFQSGDGHLFLLSLKAGGVGLNLTAADYVIHLDPWWNPAVEQQATDRAHRIGQTRPVTVYKLVLEGSVEEQILDMHGAKRELIDQVIGDQAQIGAVAVDELLGLLSGG